MWRKNVTPSDLREHLADVALRMETVVHQHELKGLGIKYSTRWSSKSVTIMIPASPNHEIKISPIDRGNKGISEWNTYTTPMHERSQDSEFEQKFPEYSIRAYIEVIDLVNPTGEGTISFTMTGKNMEQLLRGIVGFYKHVKNFEIDPQIKGGKNQ